MIGRVPVLHHPLDPIPLPQHEESVADLHAVPPTAIQHHEHLVGDQQVGFHGADNARGHVGHVVPGLQGAQLPKERSHAIATLHRFAQPNQPGVGNWPVRQTIHDHLAVDVDEVAEDQLRLGLPQRMISVDLIDGVARSALR